MQPLDKHAGCIHLVCQKLVWKQLKQAVWDDKNYSLAPHDVTFYMQHAVDKFKQMGWDRLGSLRHQYRITYCYLWFKAKDPVNKHRLLVSYWRHPLKLIYGSCTRILLFFMMMMVESLNVTHYDMPRPDVAAKVLRKMSSMVMSDTDELH